ncbi:LLM class flavin-dependent oxidoreductase, partial [Halieaceae bacterium]|nr:LLM class flavin-dependent oxidoreductase [Halieaceae bacterium]
VGGISDAAHRRAARIGDGWLSDLQTSDEIIETVQKIQQYRKEYGRDHLPFEVMASASDAYDLDGYKKLEDNGITHVLTMPWPFYHGETEELEKKIDGTKRFADDVLAKMS